MRWALAVCALAAAARAQRGNGNEVFVSRRGFGDVLYCGDWLELAVQARESACARHCAGGFCPLLRFQLSRVLYLPPREREGEAPAPAAAGEGAFGAPPGAYVEPHAVGHLGVLPCNETFFWWQVPARLSYFWSANNMDFGIDVLGRQFAVTAHYVDKPDEGSYKFPVAFDLECSYEAEPTARSEYFRPPQALGCSGCACKRGDNCDEAGDTCAIDSCQNVAQYTWRRPCRDEPGCACTADDPTACSVQRGLRCNATIGACIFRDDKPAGFSQRPTPPPTPAPPTKYGGDYYFFAGMDEDDDAEAPAVLNVPPSSPPATAETGLPIYVPVLAGIGGLALVCGLLGAFAYRRKTAATKQKMLSLAKKRALPSAPSQLNVQNPAYDTTAAAGDGGATLTASPAASTPSYRSDAYIAPMPQTYARTDSAPAIPAPSSHYSNDDSGFYAAKTHALGGQGGDGHSTFMPNYIPDLPTNLANNSVRAAPQASSNRYDDFRVTPMHSGWSRPHASTTSSTSCGLCGATFNTAQALQQHQAETHGYVSGTQLFQRQF